MKLFSAAKKMHTFYVLRGPSCTIGLKKHFSFKCLISAAWLSCIKTQMLCSRFLPGSMGQPGRVWRTVLPGLGVTFPQGSGLSYDLSVGWSG